MIANGIALHGVSKHYNLGSISLVALSDINVFIRPDCFTVISGPSGSGKTTLLNLIGGIDRPDEGSIVLDGKVIDSLSDDELSDFRAKHIGFVFQNFNLLPVLSALENIEYPLHIAGLPKRTRVARAMELLDAVGLADKADNLPGQLSGGQRQRVAVARALAVRPKLVLADEPTANLDSATGQSIIKLMRTMQREYRIAFIFSSHDPQVLAAADDVIAIRDGQLVETIKLSEVPTV